MNYKYFISQPMKGKTVQEIKEERKFIVNYLESIGNTVIDSVFDVQCKDENDAIKLLGKCIEKIAEADVVFFMQGWNKARGCKIEHEVAVEYNKKIIYMS